MRFLIVGLGSIGRRHFRNLVSLGQKDIVLLRSHHATLPDDELAGYPVETRLDKALERQKPDAVIIANPTALHMDAAVPAAAAGCHILLEKPISDSLERLDLLRQTARKSGSRILVGFQFRYHPAILKARDLIQNGMVGRLLTVHAHWGEYLPNWHPWEDYRLSYAARADLGGGVLNTLIHPFDYLRFMAGEVQSLWAFAERVSPLELNVEDIAEVGLRFSNGAVGGLHVNYFQRPPVHRFEIVGSNGTLAWDNRDGILHISHLPDPFGSYGPKPSEPVTESFEPSVGFERNDMFVAQMRHFLNVVSEGIAPLCSLDDGILALKMVLGAKRSAQNGRQFVFAREPVCRE
jgi:predicted dehydrogenase